MAHRGQVIDDGTLRLELTATAADTDGRLHEMRARYAPGSPMPPAHLHPAQQERFTVTAGRLRFDIDGATHWVGVGEEIIVPPGAVHQVSNPHEEPAEVIWQTTPALRTGEFLEAVSAARAEGGLLRLLAVVADHDDVYRLAVRPRWLTGALVRVVGGLAARRSRPSPPPARAARG
jgi:quercetin dioxygenase-like cupin family protein